jgi:hypothetical protein
MEEITQTRIYRISSRIITTDDLNKLASEIFTNKTQNPTGTFEIELQADDESTYSGRDLTLFASQNLSTKYFTKVMIKYRCYKVHILNQSVSLNLNHGDSKSDNRILVEGIDSNWVNGHIRRLSEIVESFSPQNEFVSKYSLPIAILITFVCALPIAQTFNFLLKKSLGDILYEPSLVPPLFTGIFVGSIIASAVVFRLKGLWPSIEFQIGPAHRFQQKRRRQAVIWFLTTIILPIAISALFYFLPNMESKGDIEGKRLEITNSNMLSKSVS